MVTEERRKYTRDWQRRYRANNRERLRSLGRERWKKNRQNSEWVEKYRLSQKEWMSKKRAESPELREKEKQQYAKWYERNREKKLEYAKTWRIKNIEKRRLYQKLYLREKRKDPQFKAIQNARVRINTALSERGLWKKGRTVELIGIDTKKLAEYIESKFLEGMSWDNRNLWHIDHIRPLNSFDLTDKEQQKLAFNYMNLQPLWARENLVKGSKSEIDKK